MPRPTRLQFEDAFYHVFSRGNRRLRIFWTAADYREFEELLLDLAARNNIHLYQWRLMPNHFHILLQTPDGNLSIFMQRLLGAYARYFNRTHKQVGHLFQSRYGARLCDKEEYLLELIRYIALNAHRAKNWKQLEASGESEYSSHRFYLNGNEPIAIRPFIHEVLRRFSDDLSAARDRYAAFIADGLSDPQALRSLPRTKHFLGSDHFIEETKQKAALPIRQKSRTSAFTLDLLIQRVWELMSVSENELCTNRKDRRISAARRALVYVAKRYGHFRTTILAQRLRQRPSAISQAYRDQEKALHDPIIHRLIEAVESEPHRG